jgi:NAD-dependent deacetylase
MTLITQNIDNLHQDAGSRRVVELHGNLWRLRCTVDGCEAVWEERSAPLPELPPACPTCGGLARPDIVWFHEPLPSAALRAAEEACSCDLFLVIGTSATVYPAASFPQIAQGRGAALVEINLDETPLTCRADLFIRGRAGEILPALVDEVAARVSAG